MTSTTPIQQGERRTVSGTVLNPRDDGHGHYLIDLKGTGWTQDQYAVTAFEVVKRETFQAMTVGRIVNLTVEAQKVCSGKDGSRERNWYWRIVGPSNGASPAPGEQVSSSPDQDAAYETRKAAALARDPQRDSIERQVALKAAVELAANGVLDPSDEGGLRTAIIGAADTFIAWLQGTPVEASEEQESPPALS